VIYFLDNLDSINIPQPRNIKILYFHLYRVAIRQTITVKKPIKEALFQIFILLPDREITA